MNRERSQARKLLREQIEEAVQRAAVATFGRGGFRSPQTNTKPGQSEKRALSIRPMGRNVNAFGHGKPALLRSNRQRRGAAVPL